MQEHPPLEMLDRPRASVAVPVCVGAVILWGVIRIVLFREVLVPLTYALPLLVCVWTRNRLMLWGMAAAFSCMAAAEVFWMTPQATALSHSTWSIYAAKLVNITVAGGIIHSIIHLRERLERRGLQLGRLNESLSEANGEISRQNETLVQTNRELELRNKDLAARDDEIVRQNEELAAQATELAEQNQELRSQGEELEQQSEELTAQAEELQVVNEELARREDMLSALLATASSQGSEDDVLVDVCRHGLQLLGEDVVGAAVIRSAGDNASVERYVDVDSLSPSRRIWPLRKSLAAVVMVKNRTVCLDDVSLRPDLVFPCGNGLHVCSVLGTPLRVGNEVHGVIEFYATQARSWTQHQFRLAEWLAAQCSPVLEMLELRRWRQMAEDALRESEERFRTLSRASFEGVCISEEGHIQDYNEQFCRMLGYQRGELDGKHVADLICEQSLEAVMEHIHQNRESITEHEMLRKDGTRCTVEAHGRTIQRDGQAVRITAIRDITGRRQGEERIRRSEAAYREQLAELQAIYDSVPIGLCVVDKDLRFVKINRVLAAMNRLSVEEHIGRSMFEVLPSTADQLRDALRRAVETRTPMLDVEVQGRIPDEQGTIRYFNGNYLPLLDEQLNLRGLNITVQDVTERRLAEQQRARLLEAERAARSEAERHVRLKDEFLATVSHELRSPLSAIVGWTRLLAKGSVETGKAVDIITRSASTLAQIVEDLLEMSRIISGKIRLRRATVNLDALVGDTVEGVQMAAQAKCIHIDVSMDSNLEPLVCDSNRIQQIIWNLLTNSIKFTPEQGRVYVGVHQTPSFVQIQVRDTGEGISPQFLPHIFDRFTQQDGSVARRHGGLGLGLAIAKSLVELHGGTIQAESQGEGKGATFSITLPKGTAVAAGERPWSAPQRSWPVSDPELDECALKNWKVLCVDDDLHSRELLERVVSDAGAFARTATSAEEAFALLEEMQPDVLISDVGMPGEDGYTFVERLRCLGDWRAELPCVAVTALSRPEDREQALAAGYDAHVGKPFDPGGLCLTIARLLRGRTKRSAELEPTPGGFKSLANGRGKSPPHVLVAEDNEHVSELLRTCLEERGYRVSVAASLSDSLALAKAEPVDLLLSDLRLKDGMGWDLLSRLGKQVPGVVMSGYMDEEYIKKSRAAGFAEYLVKPVDTDHLLKLVQDLLEDRPPGQPATET